MQFHEKLYLIQNYLFFLKDLWNWRATDEESQEEYLPPLKIYGEKRRKRKNPGKNRKA